MPVWQQNCQQLCGLCVLRHSPRVYGAEALAPSRQNQAATPSGGGGELTGGGGANEKSDSVGFPVSALVATSRTRCDLLVGSAATRDAHTSSARRTNCIMSSERDADRRAPLFKPILPFLRRQLFPCAARIYFLIRKRPLPPIRPKRPRFGDISWMMDLQRFLPIETVARGVEGVGRVGAGCQTLRNLPWCCSH